MDPHPTAAQLLLSSICSLSGQFARPQALSELTITHRSSELILLLWQHTGDLGHAATAPLLFFFFTQQSEVMSTSSFLHPRSDLDISQVIFHGGLRLSVPEPRSLRGDVSEYVCVHVFYLWAAQVCMTRCVMKKNEPAYT